MINPAESRRRPQDADRQTAGRNAQQPDESRTKGEALRPQIARLRAEQEREARRARRRKLSIGGGAGAVALALVVGGAWVFQGQGRNPGASSPSATTAAPSTEASTPSSTAPVATPTTYANLTRGHASGTVTYGQTPPAGGNHATAWVNCGIYDKAIPNEAAVHSLEHGAIWVTYRPDLPADQVAVLRAAVRGEPYGLLSPFPDLPDPVVATVWGTQLRLQSADAPELASFIAKYADATTAPEPRGACTGGIGTPLS